MSMTEEERFRFDLAGFFVRPAILTEAQIRVLREIRNDLISDKPMNRLIQGDVSSGKTIVAILSAIKAK